MVDMGTTGHTDPVEYYSRHFADYLAPYPRPRELFRLIVTHPHLDHMSGLARLVNRLPLVNFWYTAPNVEKEDFEGSPYDERDWDTFQKLRQGKLAPHPLSPKLGQTGHFWTDDNIYIWAPSLRAEHDAETANKPNLASYILAIWHGSGVVVLGGDAETVIWQRLFEACHWLPKVAVLKAPHHGHSSGCHEPALACMHPELTIITPDGDTEAEGFRLYGSHSRTVLRTDVDGNIVVTVRPDGSGTYQSDLIRAPTASLPPPARPLPPSWLRPGL